MVEKEIPDQPGPVTLVPTNGTASQAPSGKLSGRELTDKKLSPIAAVEGSAAGSGDEARDLLARAVADIALQRPSLRRLRRLLRSDDDKTAAGTWEQVMTFLKATKGEGGSGKPLQINLVNYVPRPQ